MEESLILFLVAYYGDDCIVAGRILQTCTKIQAYRKDIIDRYTVVKIDDDAVTRYTLNSREHREDGPAYISLTMKIWMRNDKRCNDMNGGPGYVRIDGKRSLSKYYMGGLLHNDLPNPAIIINMAGNVTTEFWLHGKRVECYI